VPFNHNHCYHPLLLRQIPEGARTALDVGCGAGLFARKLSAAGLDVDAVDPSRDMVEATRAFGSPGPGKITYRQEDVTEAELGTYDFISCLASLHHMPFETVRTLRAALRPGGVLVILGLAKPRSPADFANWLFLAPVLNLPARLMVHLGERVNGGPDPASGPPVVMDFPSMTRIRRESAALLPGRTVRPLVFWRYLLVYRAT
jgi:SAM-dependent methyltransferase